MLPTRSMLRQTLRNIVRNKSVQGHVVDGLIDEIETLADSYDAMNDMARRLEALPLRDDWTFFEPNELDAIWAECDPDRPVEPITFVDPVAIAPRVKAAFEASICGCILGKPLEINPDLARIRAAAEPVGEWPLNDYVTEAMLVGMKGRHGDWRETIRENIQYVAPDDDINYTIVGMLLLERHGVNFTKQHLSDLWFHNFAAWWQWGPERTINIKAAMRSVGGGPDEPWDEWVNLWNPGDEQCGALIRADAYGYACPGNPALAATLAWRDASYSHRRTGIYGTMFVAAAIATAFVSTDPMQIFETALKFVPRRSRFAEVVRDSIAVVRSATDWLTAYQELHGKYKEYNHCQVYQEIGTVINTLWFAKTSAKVSAYKSAKATTPTVSVVLPAHCLVLSSGLGILKSVGCGHSTTRSIRRSRHFMSNRSRPLPGGWALYRRGSPRNSLKQADLLQAHSVTTSRRLWRAAGLPARVVCRIHS